MLGQGLDMFTSICSSSCVLGGKKVSVSTRRTLLKMSGVKSAGGSGEPLGL